MDVNIETMMMDNDNVYSIHSGGYLGVQIQELTDGLRDYFKVVGQPITIVLDTNGEIIFRDFGEIKFTNF